jgi:hypothetical protein
MLQWIGAGMATQLNNHGRENDQPLRVELCGSGKPSTLPGGFAKATKATQLKTQGFTFLDGNMLLAHKTKAGKRRGPPTKPKLFGSWKARRYSQRLTAAWIEDNDWLVDGGAGPHRVHAGLFGKPETFICDCVNQAAVKDRACSHVIAVMREM